MNASDFRKIILNKVKSSLHHPPDSGNRNSLSQQFMTNETEKTAQTTSHALTAGNAACRKTLLDRFVEEINQVGGKTYRATDNHQLLLYAGEIAKKHGAGLIFRETCTEFGPSIDDFFHHTGIKIFSYSTLPDDEMMSSVDIGICCSDFGIAESGTLALLSKKGCGRLISLLPPIHIALIKPQNILPSLGELFLTLSNQSTPEKPFSTSCLTLITGPSRTGDIEQTLSIGVHGPKELHVIIAPEQENRDL